MKDLNEEVGDRNSYFNMMILQIRKQTFKYHGQVYSIQYYVLKFVSDIRQIGGFLWALLLLQPIKLTVTSTFALQVKQPVHTTVRVMPLV
jgi:hypothetical protein